MKNKIQNAENWIQQSATQIVGWTKSRTLTYAFDSLVHLISDTFAQVIFVPVSYTLGNF